MPLLDVRLPQPAKHLGFERIGSTNAEALRLAGEGVSGPIWITADEQTAGRGRDGRSWTSEPGNLYASLLVTLNCAPIVAAQLSLVAGVAVHSVLSRLAPGVPLSLKWPNDVLATGQCKIAGVLVESVLRPGSGLQAVIGMGLNLATHPAGLDRPATDLRTLGVAVTPGPALLLLSNEMQRRLELWREGAGFAEIRDEWMRASLPIGSQITVKVAGSPEPGTFLGLDDDGALLFGTSGNAPRRVTFGDVNVLAATATGT